MAMQALRQDTDSEIVAAVAGEHGFSASTHISTHEHSSLVESLSAEEEAVLYAGFCFEESPEGGHEVLASEIANDSGDTCKWPVPGAHIPATHEPDVRGKPPRLIQF